MQEAVFFYYSLNQIRIANNNIETIAVPVQKQSNALQIQLLNMAKLGSLGATQHDIDRITSSQSQFFQLNTEYIDALKILQNKVSDQAAMLSILEQIKEYYQQYISKSTSFFSAKLHVVQAKNRYLSEYKAFESSLKKASDNMLDLESMDAKGQDKLLDEVIGTGTRIDDLLFNLQNTMAGLIRIDSQTVLKQHKDDVGFLINDIQNNYIFLKKQAQPLHDDTLINDFSIELTKLNTLLVQPAELYILKEDAIQQSIMSQESYSQAEQHFNLAYQQLSQLVHLAEQRFTALQADAKDKIDTGETLAISIAFVFIILAVFIASTTTKAMLGPLNAINKALARIAQGDLSKRLDQRNDDEFGVLIGNINKLSDDLTALLNDISKDAFSLDESAQLTNKQSQNIAESTSAQINRVENAKHMAEQMFSSSTMVTNEAGITANHVSQATKYSHEIRSIADANSLRIISLSQGLSDTVGVMTRLSTHSNSIEGILDTIGSIADQTNLLALNAAIEAARAGENGRGFAVVADEVRSLASRTQASTAEIQVMVNSLQTETHAAQNAISQGQNQAAECVSQSHELNNAIEQIGGALQTIDKMSKSINNAAQEQLIFSQNIEASMIEASTAASYNAKESKDMSNRSEEVNQLAKSLTNSVERFKL